ncbi:MAG: maleylpyruvate isomerase N-terminal domain-containing protein [Actinomycetota bacterium]|nr:maleylpyruvate isomerase N-terminal domain-containing protein [Actinomycetota bacterium]
MAHSTADIVHAAQWAALRVWVDSVPPAARRQPSVLDGWTVDDLLSHLARSVDAIAALRPAGSDPTAEPTGGEATGDQDPTLTIAEYLAGFSERAEETADTTKRAAAASAADRGGELDAAFAQAQRTLAALGRSDPLVRAKGGTIRLSDFMETRIVELVVHAADLHRSLPDLLSPPLLPAAVDRVEAVLRQAFRERAGVPGDDTDVAAMAADEFIQMASGRLPAPMRLPAAVRSEFPLF